MFTFYIYVGEDKEMPVEDGMTELPLNGETGPYNNEKLVPEGTESEYKNEPCDPTETETNLEDFQVNHEENVTSNMAKESVMAIKNEDLADITMGDTTIELKDDNGTNSSVVNGELRPQSTLEMDFSADKSDVEAYNTKLRNLESELGSYKNKYEILVNNSNTIDNALLEAQRKLKEVNLRLEQKDVEISEMDLKLQKSSSRMQEELLAAEKCKTDANQCELLRSQLAKITSEKENLLIDNKRLEASAEKFQNMLHKCQESKSVKENVLDASSDDPSLLNQLETSLHEANEKISELLKVKEKYAEVDLEKTNLGNNLSELEEEMDVLSFQTRTATACSMVPLVILVLAIMVAYLPYLSSLFGTVD